MNIKKNKIVVSLMSFALALGVIVGTNFVFAPQKAVALTPNSVGGYFDCDTQEITAQNRCLFELTQSLRDANDEMALGGCFVYPYHEIDNCTIDSDTFYNGYRHAEDAYYNALPAFYFRHDYLVEINSKDNVHVSSALLQDDPMLISFWTEYNKFSLATFMAPEEMQNYICSIEHKMAPDLRDC